MVDWTLKPLRDTSGAVPGPVVVVVMDGVGVGPDDAGNAVTQARTPTLDHLRRTAGYGQLAAHGTAVGLPSDKDMGNSEVGHNAFGAGRVFDQGAKLVDEAVLSGRMFQTQTWRDLVGRSTVHLIGLLSDGNVHSHERHLHAMLARLKQDGVGRVRVHILLDGRDVPPTSSLTYVDRLEAVLSELGGDYKIASGGGRMLVTMDRYEADWRIVERGWKAHVHADARAFDSARQAIETFRAEDQGVSDQFLPEFTVRPQEPMADGDGVVFFNFRGDRALELTRAFEEGEGFAGFDRGRRPDVFYAGMMQYDGDLCLPTRFLVEPPSIDLTVGEYLARNRVTQWACSETQKYGHVTYFWNGNRSGMFDENYETYLQIESDRVPFEQRPAMKAAEIADATVAAIQSGAYRLLRLNFANGDMVGHTGDLKASIVAMETLDAALARVLAAVQKANGAMIVTADHGNCDEMLQHDKKTGAVTDQCSTAHSLNPVPCYIWGPTPRALPEGATLANVAATALHLLGYSRPDDYRPSLLS